MAGDQFVPRDVIKREVNGGMLRHSTRVVDFRGRFFLRSISLKSANYCLIQRIGDHEDTLIMGGNVLGQTFRS